MWILTPRQVAALIAAAEHRQQQQVDLAHASAYQSEWFARQKVLKPWQQYRRKADDAAPSGPPEGQDREQIVAAAQEWASSLNNREGT